MVLPRLLHEVINFCNQEAIYKVCRCNLQHFLWFCKVHVIMISSIKIIKLIALLLQSSRVYGQLNNVIIVTTHVTYATSEENKGLEKGPYLQFTKGLLFWLIYSDRKEVVLQANFTWTKSLSKPSDSMYTSHHMDCLATTSHFAIKNQPIIMVDWILNKKIMSLL